MATYYASTYAHLSAYIENCEDGDIIQLENDINVDREEPQGVDAIDLTSGTAKNVTITGSHAPNFIPNLYFSESEGTYTRLQEEPEDWETDFGDYFVYRDNAYIPVEALSYKLLNFRNAVGVTSWITTNGSLTFDHVDFQNIILNGCHWVTLDSNAVSLQVTNCRFTGSRSGEAFLFNCPHDKIVELISCAFDIPWQGAGAASTDAALAWTALAPKFAYNDTWTGSFTADFCRFHEHYTGWQIPSYQTSSPSKSQFGFSCAPFAMNGCYIYGDMRVPASGSSSGSKINVTVGAKINPGVVIAKNPQTAMNVVDVEISGSASLSSEVADENFIIKPLTYSQFCIWRSTVYGNSVGHPQYKRALASDMSTGSSISGKADPIYVDDETFASDEALFRKGFDIIVREEE